jgi:hypothetical protein
MLISFENQIIVKTTARTTPGAGRLQRREGTVGKYNKQVVGLDLGSTKVSAVVGEVTLEGDLEIIGIGSRPRKVCARGPSSTSTARSRPFSRLLKMQK